MEKTYSIEKTVDEFGADRWFVADENADWIEGPFDTYDLAHGEMMKLKTEAKEKTTP